MTTTPTGRMIGETADEYVQERAESDGDVWLKGFKEGETKLLLYPTQTGLWATYREHYDPVLRRFIPCAQSKSNPDCIGCQSEIEMVRRKNRKWIAAAFDKDNRLNYYKVGQKMFDTLKRKEQRIGTLSDREYIFIRSGTDLETTAYDIEPGEKTEVNWDDPELDKPLSNRELYISLGAKYDEYVAMALGEDPEPTPVSAADEAAAVIGGARTAAKKAAPAPAAKKAAPEPAAKEEPVSDDAEVLRDWPEPDEFEDATTSSIKNWLTSKKQEFPSRAPRSELVTLAQSVTPF